MTCQVAAANDPFYSKKYNTGTDNHDAIRNGNISSSDKMTMKNERAFGYCYRHTVESFDGYNESENHTNPKKNDSHEAEEDDDLSPSTSSTSSCPNSPGSFLSPTGNGTGKSRSIFASYWSSPKNNNTHRVMTTSSSCSGRGSENRKDNQTNGREDDDDDDVLSRLQCLALPLVEPSPSPSTNNNNNVNVDNGEAPTNIRIVNNYDQTQEYSHKVDRLEPSQEQQWKPAPAAANETTKGNPTSSSSPLSLPNPSPRTRRQILPSPPPSPHFEPFPPASSPIRANMASIDSPTTSSSWSSPSSSSSRPPFTTLPGTTLTLSPPIYYPSSPYSPIPLRESYRRTSSYPSSASSASASRPWSSTSALVKKRPSHSCLRRPRYSSFSSVEDTVSKSSSTSKDDEEDARGKCHRDGRNEVEAESITSRKPRSVSDADVFLLSAAAPSRRDHCHGDANPEEDKAEEQDAVATTHVQNARTPPSASNHTDTDEQQEQQEEEASKSTPTSSELKKQVSFYSQVAVFEFAVVQNSQAYHPPVMDAKDGWSKYFGL